MLYSLELTRDDIGEYLSTNFHHVCRTSCVDQFLLVFSCADRISSVQPTLFMVYLMFFCFCFREVVNYVNTGDDAGRKNLP